MEQREQKPPETRTASIADFFNKKSKKISDKMGRARSLAIGVDTNGTVRRREQEILHLEQREAELSHVRDFVLGALAEAPQAIGYFFLGKLDEIDLEIERIQSHPNGVFFEERVVKGKKQELEHLRTIRADMLRDGNFVLDVLGQPPLADEKNPLNS